MNHGRLPKRLVIDLDSLPAEVHGRQPGSEWNGYYRARVYHPLVASVGETGDLLDARLRGGRRTRRRAASASSSGSRTWVCEAAEPYRAGSWSRARRVVQVRWRSPLSSSPRPRRHYRGQPVENPGPGVDAFACNETRLLLAVFG